MRALGQEQKERGEIRSDVKAGQRDRKEERERERRKKKKGRPLSPHPLCRRWTLTPPLFDEPRAGFLNFVTFKFKHSHLLRSRPAQCLCLLPMPILSLFCVVFFLSLLLPRSLSCSLISWLHSSFVSRIHSYAFFVVLTRSPLTLVERAYPLRSYLHADSCIEIYVCNWADRGFLCKFVFAWRQMKERSGIHVEISLLIERYNE